MKSTTAGIRFRAAVVLVGVIVFGLVTKFYRGPGDWWVNNYGPASVAYVLAFMLAAFIVLPLRRYIVPIAIGVFVFTCLVELSQLSQAPLLQNLRTKFVGRLFLGTSFSWWDFPAYVVGSVIGYGLSLIHI